MNGTGLSPKVTLVTISQPVMRTKRINSRPDICMDDSNVVEISSINLLQA